MSEWMPSCKVIGGPVDVDLESCLQQNMGCEAFKSGYCHFDEDVVLGNIEGITDPKACQVIYFPRFLYIKLVLTTSSSFIWNQIIFCD